MVYIWSHGTPSPWCMKIRYLSSAEKYASALVPPKVSCRTLRRWRSEGRLSGPEDLSPFRAVCAWPKIQAPPPHSKATINGKARRNLGMANCCLLSLFEFHGRAYRLSVAHYFHFHLIAYLTAAQSVGEIVQILDGHGTKLDQDIARFESGLGRG